MERHNSPRALARNPHLARLHPLVVDSSVQILPRQIQAQLLADLAPRIPRPLPLSAVAVPEVDCLVKRISLRSAPHLTPLPPHSVEQRRQALVLHQARLAQLGLLSELMSAIAKALPLFHFSHILRKSPTARAINRTLSKA